MIKTQLIGNLGRDATINNVNGKTVINFSVAHTYRYTNQQGQKVEKTIWVSCALWRDKLGIVEFLRKGQQVYVSGEPALSTYTNNAREILPQLHLKVEDIQLLGSVQKNPATHAAPSKYTPIESTSTYGEPEDDLPF